MTHPAPGKPRPGARHRRDDDTVTIATHITHIRRLHRRLWTGRALNARPDSGGTR